MTDNIIDDLDDFLGATDGFEIDFQDEPLENEEIVKEDEEEPAEEEEEEPIKPSKKTTPKPIEETPEEEEEEEIEEDEIHSTFEMVAKGLQKLGKFTDIPEGKLTEEKFLELYDNFTKEKARTEVENFVLNKHGQEGLDAFQDIFVKGVSIKDYLSSYEKELTFEDVELEDNLYNQKSVVRKYLTDLDWTESDIEEHIDNLIESEKLEAMATKYKTKVVEKQKQERVALTKLQEQKNKEYKEAKDKRISDLTTAVNDAIKAKQINGIPLSVEDNKTLLNYITAEAYRLPNGTPITTFDKDYLELKKDPVKFAALAKLVKDGLNVTPIKKTGAEELTNTAFEFKKKKARSKNDFSWLDNLKI